MAGHERLNAGIDFEVPQRESIEENIFQYNRSDAINNKEQSRMKYAVAFSHFPLMIFGRIK
jgi:hypothetical protein